MKSINDIYSKQTNLEKPCEVNHVNKRDLLI